MIKGIGSVEYGWKYDKCLCYNVDVIKNFHLCEREVI